MSKINIKLLTHLHIGSGQMPQYKTEWDTFSDNGDTMIAFFDTKRIAKHIGMENVGRWTSVIERGGSTLEFIKTILPNINIETISQRTIDVWSDDVACQTIKEFIHDGMGKPYIPGSSIKGAIRTAVLASTKGDKSLEINGSSNSKNLASPVEKRLFGKDPNTDIFRTLVVGDAIFGDNYEQAVNMVNINEREKGSFWDTGKAQLIEVLGPDDKSSFSLKIKNIPNSEFKRIEELSSIEMLFKSINNHTLALLKSEADWWNSRVDNDDTGCVEMYVGEIDRLIAIANSCIPGKECVLRIGHGSG